VNEPKKAHDDTMHRQTTTQQRKDYTKRQTDTTIRPDYANAVWRMARLESRRRARQAAIPPRVGACSLRTGDASMGLPIVPLRSHGAPLRSGDPPNGSILVGGGKETKRDSPSSSERNGNSPNRIPLGNLWEM
jgi:hypothetical protein